MQDDECIHYPSHGECPDVRMLKRELAAVTAERDKLSDKLALQIGARELLYRAERNWKNAVNLWQKETGKIFFHPELGNLIGWLIGRGNKARKERDDARAALKDAMKGPVIDSETWAMWLNAAGMDENEVPTINSKNSTRQHSQKNYIGSL